MNVRLKDLVGGTKAAEVAVHHGGEEIMTGVFVTPGHTALLLDEVGFGVRRPLGEHDAKVSRSMIADGLTGHPCPAAIDGRDFGRDDLGWLECSLTVGHDGDCWLS